MWQIKIIKKKTNFICPACKIHQKRNITSLYFRLFNSMSKIVHSNRALMPINYMKTRIIKPPLMTEPMPILKVNGCCPGSLVLK